jgi:hypothetical protein
MSLRPFRLAVYVALALTLAACGSEQPQAVTEQPVAPAPATPGPTPPSTTTATPPPVTRAPPSGPACLGAVIHTVDVSTGGAPWRSVCVAVGGLLRLANLGPGSLDAASWNNVACGYEAGVHECRLIHVGTVKFTVTNSHGRRPLTVVVARASSPPKPSPACTTSTPALNAGDGGPPWRAICVKVGSVLRIENLGPEGLSVEPRGLAACRYEAAVRDCTFVKAGTVTFTVQRSPESEIRSLTVVAIA